jgi:hypothetical protein
MAGGIDITATYRIMCDNCRVEAEPGVEYHTFAEAAAARERVSTLDGWWLRWIDNFPNLLCPECAADAVVVGGPA